MALQVIPGEVTNFTVTIAIFSGCILFFGYISLLVKERLFLSEAIVAVAVGVCVGPLGSNLMNPQEWQNYHEITKQLSRCVIAIQVMTVGIELPHRYMMKEWRTVSIFLLPVMIYMWVVSGTIIWGLIRPLSFLESLLISACICPTDPVLANSVVKGRFAMKKVPPNIRHLLAAESGANDGMGFPFLFLALFLIAEDTLANAVGKWFYLSCLYQIAFSCVIGAGAGWLAREVLKFSEENYLIDKPSFLSFTIALALFLMSMTGFTGSDDLLACFVAGNVFSWDKMFIREKDESHFQEVVDTMLNLSMFVYIGTIIPWQDFGNIEIGLEKWRLVLAAFLIIFLRRLPAVVLLQPITPAIRSYREAVFSGWFGPIGVGAVFLSTIAQEELENVYEGKDHPVSTKIIGPVVLYMVFFSVVVHGSTVALINFGKRVDYSSIPSSQTYSESEQPSKENDYEDTEIVENKKLTNEKGLDNLTALGNSGIIKPIVKYDKTPLLDINHTECDLSQSNLSQANTVTSRLSSLRNIASSSSSSSSRQLSVPSNSKMIPMRKLSTGSSKDHKELNGWFFTSASSYKKQAARKARRKELKKLKGIKEIESLPTSDQEAISHVWSLFAAAPSEQRILILKGLISTCCMPQLSFLFNTTKPLLRIDFVAVLPKEITLQIFSYLDAKTLCHAAEVSHTWRFIADEDSLWHKMCEQHIDKKCEKCGWGLPLLDKKSKISIKSQSKAAQVSPMQIACGPSLPQKKTLKRKRTTTTTTSQPSRQLKRPWKEVYSERLTIERNWRTKKYKLLSLQGHTNGVMCVQFCEISKRVITGSLDKTVKVWSLETGQLLRTLTGHTREVRALQFDDAKLVTGAMDNALKIWNYHTGQCIRTLEGHTGGVLSLHFDSRTMASGSTDHTVRVWNFDLGECCTLVGHTQWVNSVRICLEGKMLISSSDDASVRLWDLQSRSCVRVFQGHVGQVQMALPSPHGFRHRLNGSPDSPIIISSALDNTIKIWDITNGKCLRTLFGHIQGIWGLDFDKLRIVSGSHDKTLRVWDAETGDCLYALEGHHGPVTAVKLSDTKIISTSDDGEVKIWDFGLIK